MNRNNGIEHFKFSIGKVLKKCGKWFQKCVGTLTVAQLLCVASFVFPTFSILKVWYHQYSFVVSDLSVIA